LDDEPVIRYSPIGALRSGESIDLVVSVAPGSTYSTGLPARNGLTSSSNLGRFGLDPGTVVTVNFALEDTVTQLPVEAPALFFSVFDIDKSSETGSESVCVEDSAFSQLYLRDGVESTDLTVAQSSTSCQGGAGSPSTVLTAQSRGWGCDNPADPLVMDVVQCADCPESCTGSTVDSFPIDPRNRTATFVFRETSSFNVTFSLVEPSSDDTRFMIFGGRSENTLCDFVPSPAPTASDTISFDLSLPVQGGAAGSASSLEDEMLTALSEALSIIDRVDLVDFDAVIVTRRRRRVLDDSQSAILTVGVSASPRLKGYNSELALVTAIQTECVDAVTLGLMTTEMSAACGDCDIEATACEATGVNFPTSSPTITTVASTGGTTGSTNLVLGAGLISGVLFLLICLILGRWAKKKKHVIVNKIEEEDEEKRGDAVASPGAMSTSMESPALSHSAGLSPRVRLQKGGVFFGPPQPLPAPKEEEEEEPEEEVSFPWKLRQHLRHKLGQGGHLDPNIDIGAAIGLDLDLMLGLDTDEDDGFFTAYEKVALSNAHKRRAMLQAMNLEHKNALEFLQEAEAEAQAAEEARKRRAERKKQEAALDKAEEAQLKSLIRAGSVDLEADAAMLAGVRAGRSVEDDAESTAAGVVDTRPRKHRGSRMRHAVVQRDGKKKKKSGEDEEEGGEGSTLSDLFTLPWFRPKHRDRKKLGAVDDLDGGLDIGEALELELDLDLDLDDDDDDYVAKHPSLNTLEGEYEANQRKRTELLEAVREAEEEAKQFILAQTQEPTFDESESEVASLAPEDRMSRSPSRGAPVRASLAIESVLADGEGAGDGGMQQQVLGHDEEEDEEARGMSAIRSAPVRASAAFDDHVFDGSGLRGRAPSGGDWEDIGEAQRDSSEPREASLSAARDAPVRASIVLHAAMGTSLDDPGEADRGAPVRASAAFQSSLRKFEEGLVGQDESSQPRPGDGQQIGGGALVDQILALGEDAGGDEDGDMAPDQDQRPFQVMSQRYDRNSLGEPMSPRTRRAQRVMPSSGLVSDIADLATKIEHDGEEDGGWT